MKSRGGYTGSYQNLVENIKLFYREMAYQLCDGFSVNTGLYSIQPNIGGVFYSANDVYNRKKNPVNFRFRVLSFLRSLANHISVEVDGIADNSGWIDEFTDIEENAVNSIFIEGNMFSVTGNKLKIAGNDPSCGLYFVPADDPSKAVKAAPIEENSNNKIIGKSVKTGLLRNRIEIRTQYTRGGKFLNSPRIITSDFVIEQA